MKSIKDLIIEFSDRAINYHKFGIEGDYKHGNAEIKKINKVYESIKKQEGMEDLLQLIYSDIPEISSLAATYCMKYNSEKCLAILNKLSKENIPFISFEVKHAIKNWENGEWYIE
jgi:hypothetical protein